MNNNNNDVHLEGEGKNNNKIEKWIYNEMMGPCNVSFYCPEKKVNQNKLIKNLN